MGAYTRDDWNKFIDSVNQVLQSPPGTDCPPVDPLPHVDPNHIWTVDDVTKVRTALTKTCSEISFEEPLTIWKQKFLDEINEKKSQAWCDCNQCDAGQTVTVPAGPIIYSNTTAAGTLIQIDMTDVINGLPAFSGTGVPPIKALFPYTADAVGDTTMFTAGVNTDGTLSTGSGRLILTIGLAPGQPPPTSFTGKACCPNFWYNVFNGNTVPADPNSRPPDGWRPCEN